MHLMTGTKKTFVFEHSHYLSSYLVKRFCEIAEEAIRLRGRFVVALSGGRSPVEFYSTLSSVGNFDLWKHTHLFWGDERFVPLDDKDSNYRMVQENLLNYINIPRNNVHPVNTDVETVEIAAEQYKNLLVSFLDFKKNGLPEFDLVLLGSGEDGHVASLFPGMQDIAAPGRVTIPVSLGHLKNERVSLSLSVINNARNIFVLFIGSKKAEISKAVIDDGADVPVARVNASGGHTFFLLDKESAALLKSPREFYFQDEAVSI